MSVIRRRQILQRVRLAVYPETVDEAIVACNPVDRQAMLDYLAIIKEQVLDSEGLTISLPCGGEKDFGVPENIPFEDLPCPCGRPDHWLIRYSLNALGHNKLAHMT